MMARRPLQIGAVLLAGEVGHVGADPRWPAIREMARTIEDAGFDSLWMPDHLLHAQQDVLAHFGQPVPEEWVTRPPTGWWDVWTLLTAIGSSTRRITFGPLVLCAPYRNPGLVAKMAATSANLLPGRLVLGLGAGDAPGEFRSFGYPSDHLASRFEDAAVIVHGLLRDGQSTHEGRFSQTHGAELRLPERAVSDPPILISAKGPRMMEIAARYADWWNAWIVFDRSHPDTARPLLAALDAACERVGREPATLRRTLGVAVDMPGDRAPAGQPISGEPAVVAETLAAFAEIGVSHLQVLIRPMSRTGIESFARVLEILDGA